MMEWYLMVRQVHYIFSSTFISRSFIGKKQCTSEVSLAMKPSKPAQSGVTIESCFFEAVVAFCNLPIIFKLASTH